MSASERRRFTRTPFETEITVRAGERLLVSNRLRDISLGGAFIIVKESLAPGTSCTLGFDLVGPHSRLHIEMQGDVVRSEPAGIAVRFTKIDLDSLVHLHHLIRVHAQDPRTISQEYEKNLLGLD